VIGEISLEFAAREGTRVRAITDALDAIIHLRHTRVFWDKNIEHADTPAALYDSRHFPDHAGRIGHVMQAVASHREVQRVIG
jgi:hypothetical protein